MRHALVDQVLERNPFYLLSALSMLVGCYTLSHSLAIRPGQVGGLLVLLLTVEIYQWLLVGLALVAMLRFGQGRDGRMLLALEMLFLADATFLDGEAFAADLTTGALVSGAACGLAAAKIAIVFRALGSGGVRRGLAPLAAPFVLLYAAPGVFAWLAHLRLLGPTTVYTAWWVAAGALAVQALLRGRTSLEPATAAFRRALGLGLPASLLLHLWAMAWVQQIDFQPAFVAPVLLALAVVDMLVETSWAASWRLRLPALAVLLSAGASEALLLHGPWDIVLSPLRLALGVAVLVCWLGYCLDGDAAFVWWAGVYGLGAVSGESVSSMTETLERLWRGAHGTGRRAWGMAAVLLAFLLLAAGALTSLHNDRALSARRRSH
jgi:hypothetical protein